MTPDAINAAAEILAGLRLHSGSGATQLDELSPGCRPQSLDDAYAIQARAREFLQARGAGTACGWKIGCTTPVMQQYLNIPHPCAGTLYSASVHAHSATLDKAVFFRLGLECELAVRLGDDLPARSGGHDRTTVAPYVESIMASIEIIDHRFADLDSVSTASLVADDFFSCGCVTGGEVSLQSIGDPALLTGGFSIDAAPAPETGKGEAILGHPLTALAWLADHLAAHGARLSRGQIVTLGSVVKTFYPSAGMQVKAVFDALEPATVNIVGSASG
ncbi:MAG: sulfate adenylyltransferase [Gammaproteobacteria bacterium]|nr:sulfate adenylyltransferase [Gammaproteobacteria bacterium]